MSSHRPRKPSAPRWQSISSPNKRKPATSVSFIFAQPETGTPLRSALENLPSLGIADSASFMSDMSKKRERSHSATSSVTPRGGDEDASKRSRVSSAANAPSIDLSAEVVREEVQTAQGNGVSLISTEG